MHTATGIIMRLCIRLSLAVLSTAFMNIYAGSDTSMTSFDTAARDLPLSILALTVIIHIHMSRRNIPICSRVVKNCSIYDLRFIKKAVQSCLDLNSFAVTQRYYYITCMVKNAWRFFSEIAIILYQWLGFHLSH